MITVFKTKTEFTKKTRKSSPKPARFEGTRYWKELKTLLDSKDIHAGLEFKIYDGEARQDRLTPKNVVRFIQKYLAEQSINYGVSFANRPDEGFFAIQVYPLVRKSKKA